MNHNWAQISYSAAYQAHLKKKKKKKKKRLIEPKKRENKMKSQEETAHLPGTELGTDTSQYGGYIIRL